MFGLMNAMKKYLFFLLLALLIFPEFQAHLKIIKSKPLSGVFENAAPPLLTMTSWNQKTYQAQCAKHFDDSLGLKSDFVRLYNQLDFSFFNVVHASKIVQGKENYLYSVDYLHAAAGKDFAGMTAIDSRIRDLKKVQEILWNQHRIFLLVVLCPDKPTFYPEYIPDRYRSRQKKMTNVKYIAQRCVKEGVHVIDFNPYFLSMKDKSRYPLIPKTGVHWSYYGAYFAADSMARYLKAKTGLPVPKFVLDSISTPALPIGEDNDMGATLNLIWDIPCQKTGYPKFHGANEPGQSKPSALFVGDSFYWNWYYDGMIGTLFSNNDFWYYCQDVFPQSSQKPTSISEIDVEDAIKRQNFIILIQVNGAYGNIGFGFTEIAMSALDPANSRLLKVELLIRTHPEWMEDVKKKAEHNHLKVEEQLRMDALWMIEQENKQSQHKN
jgi:hypothetical protein